MTESTENEMGPMEILAESNPYKYNKTCQEIARKKIKIKYTQL